MALAKLEDALEGSYLMALWLSIHGGDPGPLERLVSKEEAAAVATKLIASLQPFTKGVTATSALAVPNLTIKSLEETLASMRAIGIEVHAHVGQERVEINALSTHGRRAPRICPCFGPPNHRKCYCFDLNDANL